MPSRIVYLNGRFIHETEARISIYDSALLTGDMAFDSTRTFAGVPFQLDSHLDRLERTLEILGIDCGTSWEELHQATLETLEQNQQTESTEMEWQIVHNISRGIVPPFQAAFPNELGPTVCISCWPLLPQLARMAPLYREGVSLVVPEQRAIPPRFLNPEAKTRSRVHAKIAQLQAAKEKPAAWPLLLDEEGFLAEGPAWNIFLVKDGCLKTPTTRNVLPGVSRTLTMQFAQEQEIPVVETDLTVDEARSADEMFCTATSFCVLPVRAFDGEPLESSMPGPTTQFLMEAWKNHVGIDFVAQAESFAQAWPSWLKREHAGG